jgi:hypothetical protein
MRIFYEITLENSVDITDICLSKLKTNNIINIPPGDNNRAYYFIDL